MNASWVMWAKRKPRIAAASAVVGPLVGALDPMADVVADQVSAADDEVENAADREQRIRQERAAAVRDHRAAAVTVAEAGGLFDAAEAAYLAALPMHIDSGRPGA